jgi:hypothetical protein
LCCSTTQQCSIITQCRSKVVGLARFVRGAEVEAVTTVAIQPNPTYATMGGAVRRPQGARVVPSIMIRFLQMNQFVLPSVRSLESLAVRGRAQLP